MKKIVIIIISILVLTGCANNEIKKNNNEISTDTNFSLHLKNQKGSIMDAYDPLEPWNRRMYYLNYELDKYLVLPVSNSYNFFLPHTARTGIGNFFSNLHEPINAINGILILNSKVFFRGLGRFLINTTVGVLGLVDVATMIKLTPINVSLNETLAIYGVGKGPYLIIPFLGPSYLRKATSDLITFIIRMPLDPINVYTGDLGEDIAIKSVEAINFRSKIPFKYYSLGTPFEYEYIRLLYFTSSDLKVESLRKK